MNPDLTEFSNWVLALLPRLLLYPGGLWALAGWLILRGACGRRGEAVLSPHALAASLAQSQVAAALAMSALAVLPLPGAAPLPFPADRLALAGLLLASLVVQQLNGGAIPAAHISANVTLSLAALAPLAGGATLLPAGGGSSLPGWLAAIAGLAGLCAVARGQTGLPDGLRLLAWAGLLGAPLWGATDGSLAGAAWVSLVYLGAIAIAGLCARLFKRNAAQTEATERLLAAICWGFPALALVAALV